MFSTTKPYLRREAMTEEQVITIYCFCDDFLKVRGHRDWPNVKMTLYALHFANSK
jgi:hypothetical protein